MAYAHNFFNQMKSHSLLVNMYQNRYTTSGLHVSEVIQLMPSFEVNIRICQPENSAVHRGKAKVNITVLTK